MVVITNITTEDVLDLLLLETTLDNKTSRSIDGTTGTQLSEQVLGDVLIGTLHALANLVDIGEDRLLVSFTETLWWWNLV